jgi:hypothetical protein
VLPLSSLVPLNGFKAAIQAAIDFERGVGKVQAVTGWTTELTQERIIRRAQVYNRPLAEACHELYTEAVRGCLVTAPATNTPEHTSANRVLSADTTIARVNARLGGVRGNRSQRRQR